MNEQIEQGLLQENLARRSIIPLLHRPPRPPTVRSLGFASLAGGAGSPLADTEEYPDLDDVQGDVIYLFPKKAQNFIFFRIANTIAFKKALATFLTEVTTAHGNADFLLEIARFKAARPNAGVINKANSQIAFSRMGLYALGIQEDTGDAHFDKYAMRDNKTLLTDQRNWDPAFEKTNFDPVEGSVHDDSGALHGVITIAGSGPEICEDTAEEALKHFGSSITVVGVEKGRARPSPWSGHEHFGYKDGVSQPALRGLAVPKPGQVEVDPGVIVMGYRGDPVLEDPALPQRPTWTKGGTMMVFRKLEQFVPEFDRYLAKNGPRWREFAPNFQGAPLSDGEGAALWGARLFGRWKSGAPLQLAPFRDDPEMAKDPSKNNNFDYRVEGKPGQPTDLYCPFTAHIRKTVPRSLDPYIQKRYLEGGMIVRGGIPYGIEVTAEEHAKGVSSEDPSKKRGLLFVCYQSSLDQGFVRQTIDYAGNDYFPTTSILPTNHGQDPIIGGPPPPARTTPAQNEVEYVNRASGNPPQSLLLTLANGNKLGVNATQPIRRDPIIDPPGIRVQFLPNPLVQPKLGDHVDLVLPPRPNTFDPIPVSGGTRAPTQGVDVKYVANPRVPLQNGDQVNLIIDAANGDEITVSGVAKVRPKSAIDPPGYPEEFFVTSRGGEWFFVPPISTLEKWSKVNHALDIMLILDTTNNMQAYLNQFRDSIDSIVTNLMESGNWTEGDIRIGVVAFRDHHQRDSRGNLRRYEYVTKPFGFSAEIAKVKATVASLTAADGGDGPDAQCHGLLGALNSDWKDGAAKIAILLTDSSPHGIGESGDALPGGCPEGSDPVRIVDFMTKKGIILHVLACELTLTGSYQRAHDFYTGMAQKTCGKMDALINKDAIETLVVGRVLESVDILNMADEQRSFIQSQFQGGREVPEIGRSLYDRLSKQNAQLYHFDVESIYLANQVADANAKIWRNATGLDSATMGKLQSVGLRFRQQYRKGGSEYGKKQPMKLIKDGVSLTQCEQIVQVYQNTI